MTFVADLHLHSSFAYATSSALTLDSLVHWARLKGIQLLSTADFTHPEWFRQLKEQLYRTEDGLYGYGGVSFVPGTEVSCIFRQDGRGRRVHLLVLAPDLDTVAGINQALSRYGNLELDGRPTLALSVRDLTELVLQVNAMCIVIPAHAWTPWYGLYGSKSGFDRLWDAFGDMADCIPAVETGLSSDPAMNWAISELAGKTIVSFSDAHSLAKLGREVTVFDAELSYARLAAGLWDNRVAYTVEMYPEEGKYHYDGHRKCRVALHPDDTRRQGTACPHCRRPLTLGVLHRVHRLCDGPIESGQPTNIRHEGLPEGVITSSTGRPPFVRLAPLLDLISAVRGRGANTKRVLSEYERIVREIGTELQTALWAAPAELESCAGPDLARAILQNRRGELRVEPGYDGVYGKLSIKPD